METDFVVFLGVIWKDKFLCVRLLLACVVVLTVCVCGVRLQKLFFVC